MDTTTIIGVLGAGLLLVAFIANEFNLLTARSLRYDLLNLVGGALLVWYAVLLNSLPFLILEGVWALVAFRDIFSKLAGGAKNR